MKFLFDLLPVILFFIAFKTTESRPQAAADLIGPLLGAVGLNSAIPLEQSPILLATMVVMLATAAQIAWRPAAWAKRATAGRHGSQRTG